MNKPEDKIKFENPFGNIFSTVQAQGVDTVAGPTLPVDPDIGTGSTSTVTPSVTQPAGTEDGVRVLLESDKTEGLDISDTFTLSIELESLEELVLEFNIVLNYNPNKLSTGNTTYLDTYFTNSSEIEVDNLEGIITIKGKATGEARTINREISEIIFNIVSNGSITVEVDETSSYINSSDGTNLLSGTKNLYLQVGDIIDPIETVTPSTTNLEGTPEAIYTAKPTFYIQRIPKSSLESPSDFVPVAVGSLLVILGLWLALTRKNKDDLY